MIDDVIIYVLPEAGVGLSLSTAEGYLQYFVFYRSIQNAACVSRRVKSAVETGYGGLLNRLTARYPRLMNESYHSRHLQRSEACNTSCD